MDHYSKTVPGTQAVARAVAILKAFSDEHPRWRVSDLARALVLPKPTVVRLLSALGREGMVVRDGATNSYSLGPGAIALGSLALRSNDLRTTARVELEALAAASQESSTLEVMIGDEVLVVDEVRVWHLLGTAPDIGTRWPAHATSTGKVLLAYNGGAASTAKLAKLTPHTITSPAVLRRELATVRGQGYASAVEELVEGFVAVAAPIRDHEGHVVAALSVGGLSVRVTPARVPELAVLVRQAADRVTQRLGGA